MPLPFSASSLKSTLKSTIANQPLLSNLSSQASSLAQKTGPILGAINQQLQEQFQQQPQSQAVPPQREAAASSKTTAGPNLHYKNQDQNMIRNFSDNQQQRFPPQSNFAPNNGLVGASSSLVNSAAVSSCGGGSGGLQRPPPVDLSHLTAEERAMIQSVMAKDQMVNYNGLSQVAGQGDTQIQSIRQANFANQSQQQQMHQNPQQQPQVAQMASASNPNQQPRLGQPQFQTQQNTGQTLGQFDATNPMGANGQVANSTIGPQQQQQLAFQPNQQQQSNLMNYNQSSQASQLPSLEARTQQLVSQINSQFNLGSGSQNPPQQQQHPPATSSQQMSSGLGNAPVISNTNFNQNPMGQFQQPQLGGQMMNASNAPQQPVSNAQQQQQQAGLMMNQSPPVLMQNQPVTSQLQNINQASAFQPQQQANTLAQMGPVMQHNSQLALQQQQPQASPLPNMQSQQPLPGQLGPQTSLDSAFLQQQQQRSALGAFPMPNQMMHSNQLPLAQGQIPNLGTISSAASNFAAPQQSFNLTQMPGNMMLGQPQQQFLPSGPLMQQPQPFDARQSIKFKPEWRQWTRHDQHEALSEQEFDQIEEATTSNLSTKTRRDRAGLRRFDSADVPDDESRSSRRRHQDGQAPSDFRQATRQLPRPGPSGARQLRKSPATALANDSQQQQRRVLAPSKDPSKRQTTNSSWRFSSQNHERLSSCSSLASDLEELEESSASRSDSGLPSADQPAQAPKPTGGKSKSKQSSNSQRQQQQQNSASRTTCQGDANNNTQLQSQLHDLKLTEQANQVMEQQQQLIKQSQELIKLQQAQLEQQAENKVKTQLSRQESVQDQAARQIVGQSQQSRDEAPSMDKQAEHKSFESTQTQQRPAPTKTDSAVQANEGSPRVRRDNMRPAVTSRSTTIDVGDLAPLDSPTEGGGEKIWINPGSEQHRRQQQQLHRGENVLAANLYRAQLTRDDLLDSPIDTTDSDLDLISQSTQVLSRRHHHSLKPTSRISMASKQAAARRAHKQSSGLPPSPLPVVAAIQLHQLQEQHSREGAELEERRCHRQGTNLLRSRSVCNSPQHQRITRGRAISPDAMSELSLRLRQSSQNKKHLPDPPSNAVPLTPSMVKKMIQAQRVGATSSDKLLTSVNAQTTLLTNTHSLRQPCLDQLSPDQRRAAACSGTNSLITNRQYYDATGSSSANQPTSSSAIGSYTAKISGAQVSFTDSFERSQLQTARHHRLSALSRTDLSKYLDSTFGTSILKNSPQSSTSQLTRRKMNSDPESSALPSARTQAIDRLPWHSSVLDSLPSRHQQDPTTSSMFARQSSTSTLPNQVHQTDQAQPSLASTYINKPSPYLNYQSRYATPYNSSLMSRRNSEAENTLSAYQNRHPTGRRVNFNSDQIDGNAGSRFGLIDYSLPSNYSSLYSPTRDHTMSSPYRYLPATSDRYTGGTRPFERYSSSDRWP